ncbi:MAG: heme ABC transporter ATP-binding protein, partial [Pseudomonadota bacterium]
FMTIIRSDSPRISSSSIELEEILGLSDRIMVMNAGEQMGILDRDEADERTLGLMMAGITGSNAA